MLIWVFPPNNASLSSTQVTTIVQPVLNGKPQITMPHDLHSWSQCLNLFNGKDGHSHCAYCLRIDHVKDIDNPDLDIYCVVMHMSTWSAIFAQSQIFPKPFSLKRSQVLKPGDDQHTHKKPTQG